MTKGMKSESPDTNARYQIASTSVEVQYGSGPSSALLRHEMKGYPASGKPAELVIRINPPNEETPVVARNPQLHCVTPGGFTADFGRYQVRWNAADPVVVDLLNFDEHRKSIVRKIWSMGYTHPFEGIGQIFHEIVLIPTLFMYFNQRLAVLHGSAVQKPDGGGLLVTGTGGVGKTSLMLDLVRERGCRFISDDMSLLDSEGNLWANRSFPKIYAYNVVGDTALLTTLMKGRSVADRLQWGLKQRSGRSKVRRRVDPEDLFAGNVADTAALDTVYLICRRAVKKVEVHEISANDAIDVELALLQAEYPVIFNQLHWHRFNLKTLGQAPGLDSTQVLSNLRTVLSSAFESRRTVVLNVPLDCSARRLQTEFAAVSEI
jgi:hypothetical protein